MFFIKDKLKSTVTRYYLFNFFTSLHFFSAVLVPFFTEWGGITLFQVQLLQSWFAFWLFVLEVPTGAVADYLGRKHSLAMGAIISGFGAIIYSSFPIFAFFLLGEFMLALGLALMTGADEALLYDSLKEQGQENKSTEIFGKAQSFNLFGMFVAAILGGFIAAQFGINAAMMFTAFPMFIATAIAWSIREPQIKHSVSERKRYLDIMKTGWQYFRTHKTLRLITLDLVGVSVAAYFVMWLYQPLLSSLQFPIIYFGLVHGGLLLMEMLVSSNFGKLEKLLGSANNYLRFTALITGVAFIITAIYTTIWTVLLFVILAGGFGMTRMQFITAKVNKFIESEQRATVLSFINMMRRLSYAIMNPIVGLIATQSLRGALLFIGIFPLAVWWWSRRKQVFC